VARATIESPQAFDDVDLSESLTAFVAGSLDGGPEDALVAVALNGRIGGVSPTFARNGAGGGFEVLIPDDFFRQGRNDLRLYLVQGSVLQPLAIG
jgi:hypothetical protein